MVDVDTFLTTLYVVIDEFAKSEAPPAPPSVGRRRRLCLSEVLTLAVFGQWSGFASQRAFYRYAQRHLRAAFPALPARSQLNRALRAAEGALSRLGPYLAAELGAAQEPCEVLDSTGLPMRDSRRRGRSWLAGQANLGRCTRIGWYYGLHALTCCTREGVITGSGLAPASTNDQRLAETFFRARRVHPSPLPGVGRPAAGQYVADTGFDRPATPQFWAVLARAVWRAGGEHALSQSAALAARFAALVGGLAPDRGERAYEAPAHLWDGTGAPTCARWDPGALGGGRWAAQFLLLAQSPARTSTARLCRSA